MVALLAPVAIAEHVPTCAGELACADAMPCEALGPERCTMIRDYVDQLIGLLP